MRRRAFLGALGAAPSFALIRYVKGQERVPRIGFLTLNVEGTPQEQGFRQGLHELGYSEGRSITIEWRRAIRSRKELPRLVSELVHMEVDLIVTVGTSTARCIGGH